MKQAEIRRWKNALGFSTELAAAPAGVAEAGPSETSPSAQSAPATPWAGILQQLSLAAKVLALSACSYYVISSYVLHAVVVQGRSMEPTLQDGERHLLNRFSYHCRAPQRRELVVLRDPGHSDCAIKRVVGLLGDLVDLQDGRVHLNGRALPEPYLHPHTRTDPIIQAFPIRLGAEQYFVLGDNRQNSEDSRVYGAISRGQILGCLMD